MEGSRPLIYRIDVNGESCTLDLRQNGTHAGWEYSLQGVTTLSGSASVVEIAPGTFSVLLRNRSFTVHLSRSGDGLEVSSGSETYFLSVLDPRDRLRGGKKAEASGVVNVRAHMPGKIIKLLVDAGQSVDAGQGLVVVEAMKMQNELKAPKGGLIKAINIDEGATVAAGESLVVIE